MLLQNSAREALWGNWLSKSEVRSREGRRKRYSATGTCCMTMYSCFLIGIVNYSTYTRLTSLPSTLLSTLFFSVQNSSCNPTCTVHILHTLCRHLSCSHLPIATGTPLPRIRIQRRPPNAQITSFTHRTSTVTSRAGAVVLRYWFGIGVGFWRRVRYRDDSSH